MHYTDLQSQAKKSFSKMIDKISSAGIIGSGTMGSGIATSFLLSGYKVVLYDVKSEMLDKAGKAISKNFSYLINQKKLQISKADELKNNCLYTDNIKDLNDCDIIIEAAIENFNIKTEILKSLNKIVNESAIIATNTSSMSITALSSVVLNPNRFIGMHFFNPANIMKLVEIVTGSSTSKQTLNVVIDLVKKLNKVPVVCKDTPAFIVNRIARPFYGEALKILGEGGITHEITDDIMKNEGGFKMGPFELMDLIGIDINYDVTRSVYEAFYYDEKYKPHYIQKKMIDSGTLGKKTGKGFYSY